VAAANVDFAFGIYCNTRLKFDEFRHSLYGKFGNTRFRNRRGGGSQILLNKRAFCCNNDGFSIYDSSNQLTPKNPYLKGDGFAADGTRGM